MAIDLRKGKLMDQADRNERRARALAERDKSRAQLKAARAAAAPMLIGCGWVVGAMMIIAGAFMVSFPLGIIALGIYCIIVTVGLTENRKKKSDESPEQ